jgi:hypothetical protein
MPEKSMRKTNTGKTGNNDFGATFSESQVRFVSGDAIWLLLREQLAGRAFSQIRERQGGPEYLQG